MLRDLESVIADQAGVFDELLEAERQLSALNDAGGEFGIVDGASSEIDLALAAVHEAQHRLDALLAEGLQAALANPSTPTPSH